MTRALREIIVTLPEPWSLNNLIRMSYHMRNQRREMLKKLLQKQLEENYGVKFKKSGTPTNFTPLTFVRADAIVTLRALRDDFELPACLKIEMDAAQEVGLLSSDAPSHLVRGVISQRRGSQRGVRIRFTELAEAPTQPFVDF